MVHFIVDNRAGFSLSRALLKNKMWGPPYTNTARLTLYDARATQNRFLIIIMVALCNRTDHYIFILFLSSFFLLSSFFFLSFPRLISAVGDWMFTIIWHMVWP